MDYRAIFFLLACLTFLIEGVNGVCCNPRSVCGDGTPPTPHCGYGKCNMFGCDCTGGCRSGTCFSQISAINSAALFKQIDLNK